MITRLVTSMLCALVPLLAAAGDWRQVHPRDEPADLVDVVDHDGTWVAVSDDGRLLSSHDGVEWSTRRLPEGYVPERLVSAGGRLLVRVRRDDQPSRKLLLVQRDDSSWFTTNAGMQYVFGVAWDGECWIAAGGHSGWKLDSFATSTITVSRDLVSWQQVLFSDAGLTWDTVVAVGNGRRIVHPWPEPQSDEGVGFAYSDDGVSWFTGETRRVLREVVYDGHRFVACDRWPYVVGGPCLVVTSLDGLEWDEHGVAMERPLSLGCGEGGCVVVGAEGAATFFDPLLGTLEPLRPATGADLNGVACRGRACVAVGDAETIVTGSLDGGPWRLVASKALPDLRAAAVHGRRWVAVGAAVRPSTAALWSDGGGDWTPASMPEPDLVLNDVVWFEESFVAVGDGGRLLASADGEGWRPLGSPTAEDLRAVASGDGLAVAVGGGERGVVLVSRDGHSWRDASVAAPPLEDVTWDGRRFLAVGGEGVLVTSANGERWSVESTGCEHATRWVASNGRRTLAGCGDPSSRVRVDDGEWEWGPYLSNTYSVEWTGRSFVALRYDSTASSPDGLTWSPEGYLQPRGAAAADPSTVLVGDRGRIVRRDRFEGASSPAVSRTVVPTLAHLDGAAGSAWRSRLLLRPSDDANPTLFLLDGGAAEIDARARDVSSRWRTVLEDPVLESFGLERAAAPLLVLGDAPTSVTSLLEATSERGTFRQVVPGTSPRVGREPLLLPLPGYEPGLRANLLLANPEVSEMTVEVEVVAGDGGVLGRLGATVPPLSSEMLQDVVLRAAGSADLPDPVLRVRTLSGPAAPTAMVSLLDRRSGDPVTVLPAATSDEALVVPAVAHARGRNGAEWRSDLLLHNPGHEIARYRLELRPEGRSTTVLRTPELRLGAGRSAAYRDLVRSVFGHTGAGWLRVALVSGELAGACRIHDAARPSSPGMVVAATDVADVPILEKTELAPVMVSRPARGSLRATLDLVNLDDVPTQVYVVVYSAGVGAAARWWTVSIPARSLRRESITIALDQWGFEPDDGLFSIEVRQPQIFYGRDEPARVLVGASTVDGATGDAFYVVGR